MSWLNDLIKYNPLTVSLYNAWLNNRTSGVDAYVFVATTGRSGSESLSKIFQAADRAVCFHEPYPIMFADYTDSGERAEYFDQLFRQRKRINIKRSAVGYRYYVETNHQFVKNFLPQAVSHLGDKIRIIHMVRDACAVASSFYSINSVPGKTRVGQHYLLYPEHEDNRIQISDLLYRDPDFSHDLYKCLWYWYEIEVRVADYRAKLPNVRWHTLKTEELNDESSLTGMFDGLGIKFSPEKLANLVGSRANRKTDLKKKSIDPQECAEMNQRLKEKISERYPGAFV